MRISVTVDDVTIEVEREGSFELATVIDLLVRKATLRPPGVPNVVPTNSRLEVWQACMDGPQAVESAEPEPCTIDKSADVIGRINEEQAEDPAVAHVALAEWPDDEFLRSVKSLCVGLTDAVNAYTGRRNEEYRRMADEADK